MQDLINRISKYNLWDNKKINIGYHRKLYLDRILQYMDNKLIKVIVGQRRVGKSYILRQIMSNLISENNVNPKNIFYLNKEYLAFDIIKTSEDLAKVYEFYESTISKPGKKYIFIDEIQDIEEWERFINSYSQDFIGDYELFISGSNSNLLSGELSSLLSGRYVEFEILPFDLYEFTDFKKIKVNKTSFIKYLQSSGLPELFNLNTKESKRNYVFALKNTIILRDIIYRFNIKDPALLEELFNFIVSNIGHLTSIPSIIKYYKSKQKRTNYDTISNYLNHLKSSFIIHEVERYNIKGKQNLGGEKKYYINDLGFKNYLHGIFPDDIGNILENYVFTQLKRKGYGVKVGIWGKSEVDFIATLNEKTIYFQVAYLLKEQQTIDREFGNLLKINDNLEKVVITLDDIQFSDYKGIKHIKPWEIDSIL